MTFNRFAIPAIALVFGVAASSSASASTTAAIVGEPDAAIASALPQEHGGWDMPPSDLPEAQHQGFRDGVDGARKDYDHHRHFNVNNRDEFRHPHVPREEREAYREGFRRGYEVGTHHMMEDHDRDHDRDHDHNPY